jgi:hypothetical protein
MAVTGWPEQLDDAKALLHGQEGGAALPPPRAEARAQLRKLIELNDGPAIALFCRPSTDPETGRR